LQKLNGEQQAKVEELTHRLGVNEEQLHTFFRIIGEAEVKPEQIGAKLIEIATHYLELRAQLDTTSSADPEVQRLKEEARAALDRGDFARTEDLLNQAKA